MKKILGLGIIILGITIMISSLAEKELGLLSVGLMIIIIGGSLL